MKKNAFFLQITLDQPQSSAYTSTPADKAGTRRKRQATKSPLFEQVKSN
jgi:hypothetical protein